MITDVAKALVLYIYMLIASIHSEWVGISDSSTSYDRWANINTFNVRVHDLPA